METSSDKSYYSSERTKIIDRLWKEIHGIYVPLFYWRDGSMTSYFYDPVANAIICDLGFGVELDVEDDKLTKQYIRNKIRDLENDIYNYWYKTYGIKLLYDD